MPSHPCDVPTALCGQRQRVLARPGWFQARFAGFCLYCQERYRVGDPIIKIGGGYFVGWCCERLFVEPASPLESKVG